MRDRDGPLAAWVLPPLPPPPPPLPPAPRSRFRPAAVRAQAVQAPTKSDVRNVNDVGLKDVPLRSLFPEEPAAPRPVRGCSRGSHMLRCLCPFLGSAL